MVPIAFPVEEHSLVLSVYHFTEMCCGNEAGSYLRRIESCITQLKAQGPSRTCNESKEQEEQGLAFRVSCDVLSV